MLFSVIYSADCPRDISIVQLAPPRRQRKLWKCTEGDEQYDVEGFGEGWERGKHRKWCALLTRKQFDLFVEHTGLVADNVETMGSLGASGFGDGWVPAISFSHDCEVCMLNAYVTPIVLEYSLKTFQKRKLKRPLDEDAWRRVRNAVLSVYG